MKTFFLLRLEDVHGLSGEGVVAEGCVFDNGIACMTWLTDDPTVTMFPKITTVKKLHGHEGRTLIIMEKDKKLYQKCKEEVRNKKLKARQKEKEETDDRPNASSRGASEQGSENN